MSTPEIPLLLFLSTTGSVDTTAEIIGATVALEELDLLRNTMIYSTPVPVGGGLFKFSVSMNSEFAKLRHR